MSTVEVNVTYSMLEIFELGVGELEERQLSMFCCRMPENLMAGSLGMGFDRPRCQPIEPEDGAYSSPAQMDAESKGSTAISDPRFSVDAFKHSKCD